MGNYLDANLPQSQGTVVAGSVKTLIYGPADIGNDVYKSLFVRNFGAFPLTSGIVEVSGDGANWGTVDGTTFQTLGSGAIAFNGWTNSYRYWKFSAAGASGSIATLCFWWNFG